MTSGLEVSARAADERRSHGRVSPVCGLTVDFIWSHTAAATTKPAVPATVVDLSPEGMQASVPYRLPIGMDVVFWLNVSDRERCRLSGTVVWNAELQDYSPGELPYRIGMSLRRPEGTDDRAVWERAVATCGAR